MDMHAGHEGIQKGAKGRVSVIFIGNQTPLIVYDENYN